MELPAHNSKRRRLVKLAAGRFPPAPGATEPTEVPNPRSTIHNQEAPPPDAGGEGGGVDRISALPDAILGDIVTLLPTKDAARIQTLASRWRHVWRAAPLVVDGADLIPKGLRFHDKDAADASDKALASAVSRVVSAHRGPGRRFSIPTHHLYNRPDAVDAWLRSAALDNLQELDFWTDKTFWYRKEFPPVPPPASVFRFSATLRVATFSNCQLVDGTVDAHHFPQLRLLGLVEVSISERLLHTMISRCPALECLLLDRTYGFRCVRINSNGLRSICVGVVYHETHQFQELIVEDAPCLERLLNLQELGNLRISVISAPKLVTLGCFSDRDNRFTHSFGATTIKDLHISMKMAATNIKIVAVKSWDLNLDMVIDLLKCLPCLEKLYLKSQMVWGMNLWRRKHKHFIQSFDFRLKTFVLGSYKGIKAQVNFVSFFVLNARELQLIRLEVKPRDYCEALFSEQHRMLQMENRASRDAQLHFTTDRCHHDLLHVNHVRDLLIDDPYECRC